MSLKTGDPDETMEIAAARSWPHPAPNSRNMPCHAACCTDAVTGGVAPSSTPSPRFHSQTSHARYVHLLWAKAHSGAPALVALVSPVKV